MSCSTVSQPCFFLQNDEKLVFWYCSSFFCPLDLSGLRDTDTRAKSLSSITCHRKFSQLRHDGGRNTFHAITQQPTGFWPKTMYSLKAHGAPDTPNSLFGAALRSITQVREILSRSCHNPRILLADPPHSPFFNKIYFLFLQCAFSSPDFCHLLVDCCICQVSQLFFIHFCLLPRSTDFQFLASFLRISS